MRPKIAFGDFERAHHLTVGRAKESAGPTARHDNRHATLGEREVETAMRLFVVLPRCDLPELAARRQIPQADALVAANRGRIAGWRERDGIAAEDGVESTNDAIRLEVPEHGQPE